MPEKSKYKWTLFRGSAVPVPKTYTLRGILNLAATLKWVSFTLQQTSPPEQQSYQLTGRQQKTQSQSVPYGKQKNPFPYWELKTNHVVQGQWLTDWAIPATWNILSCLIIQHSEDIPAIEVTTKPALNTCSLIWPHVWNANPCLTFTSCITANMQSNWPHDAVAFC